MIARYGIYFTPAADTPLWQFGTCWLGRDPLTGAVLEQPACAGLDPARHAQITESPRHYGFHATLKPPFALAGGADETDLLAALNEFAATRPAFAAPALQLSAIGGFLALTLSAPSAEMQGFAAACVETFDRFRAPQSAAELERRRKNGLTPRQEELLAHWGYPYVFDEFRFHMTLTGGLDDDERSHVQSILAPQVTPLCADPLPVDAIALYRQDNKDTPFTIVKRLLLTGKLQTQQTSSSSINEKRQHLLPRKPINSRTY